MLVLIQHLEGRPRHEAARGDGAINVSDLLDFLLVYDTPEGSALETPTEDQDGCYTLES